MRFSAASTSDTILRKELSDGSGGGGREGLPTPSHRRRREAAGRFGSGGPAVRPSFLMAASAARSPDAQAPPTVPHRVSWVASPAKKMRSRTGSASAARAHWPPGEAAEKAPNVHGSWFH